MSLNLFIFVKKDIIFFLVKYFPFDKQMLFSLLLYSINQFND